MRFWCGASTVMAGYLDDSSATEDAIRNGWLHTGDIGWLGPDGCLRIVDRLKDMIIVGGFNVYPAEIERTLLEHGDVEQAAVVGVPDERFGELPVAAVVLRQGVAPKIDVLMAFCRERLADFKRPRSNSRGRRPPGQRRRKGGQGRSAGPTLRVNLVALDPALSWGRCHPGGFPPCSSFQRDNGDGPRRLAGPRLGPRPLAATVGRGLRASVPATAGCLAEVPWRRPSPAQKARPAGSRNGWQLSTSDR